MSPSCYFAPSVSEIHTAAVSTCAAKTHAVIVIDIFVHAVPQFACYSAVHLEEVSVLYREH